MDRRRRANLQSLLIAFSLSTSLSFGQKFDWAYSNGSWVTDFASQTIIDASGNSYITGQVGWSTDFSPTVHSDLWAAYVAKLDPSGHLLWVQLGEGSSEGGGTDLALDSEGNLYVTGFFRHSIVFNDNVELRAGIQPKSFLVKYTAAGQFLWARVVGSYESGPTLANVSRAIAIDHQDNIYITGSFVPTLPLDNGGVLNDLYQHYWPDTDMFLLKYDKDGILIWGKVAATPFKDDFVTAMKVTPDNKLVLALRLGSGTFKYDNSAQQNYSFTEGSLIVTLDTSGTWINATPLNGFVSDLSINHDGAIVAVGIFFNAIMLGELELTSEWSDGFVAVLNADHAIRWGKKVSISNMHVAYHGDAIYVTGLATPDTSIDGLHLPKTEYSSSVVFKLNADGYGQWLKGLGSRIQTTSIYLSDSGDIGITGLYTSLTLDLDDIQLSNKSGNGDADFFAAVMTDELLIRCPEVMLTLAADKNAVCDGDFATLTPTPAGWAIRWFKDGQELKSGVSAPIQTDETGEFYFVTNPSAFGCDAVTSPSVKIRVIEIPDATISATPGVLSCNDEPIQLSVEDKSTYSYVWLKDNAIIASQTSSLLEVTGNGQYRVIVSNEGMCSSETSQSVTVLPEETAFLPDTVLHCAGTSVSVKPVTKFAGWNYQWSSGNTTNDLHVSTDGIYELTLSYEHCETKETTVIKTYPDILVPNVVTPNNDLKNDFFMVENPSKEAIRIQILTRWGKQIYQSDDYQNGWPQDNISAGVYYYTIEGTGCYNGKKGWVHVVR